MDTVSKELMECLICSEIMQPPISQCQKGHSMCGSCVRQDQVVNCPLCFASISNSRNYQLEQLIEGVQKILKQSCYFKSRGCKMQLSTNEKDNHERECKFRDFSCEGRNFAQWKCDWSGKLPDLYQHFQGVHNNQKLSFKSEACIKLCLTANFADVQMISFYEGSQYFWYKHMVNINEKRVYWVFQYIGLQKDASKYFYEFEIFDGPTRKHKITEICENDTFPTNEILKSGKCVMLPFDSIKNFIDSNGFINFKYRIMAKKNTH